MGFAVLATRRGEHWALSEVEADNLGQAWANLLKYAPVPAEQAGIVVDVVTAGVVSVAVVSARLIQDARLRKARGYAGASPQAPYPEQRASQPIRANGFGENHASETNAQGFFGDLGSP